MAVSAVTKLKHQACILDVFRMSDLFRSAYYRLYPHAKWGDVRNHVGLDATSFAALAYPPRPASYIDETESSAERACRDETPRPKSPHVVRAGRLE